MEKSLKSHNIQTCEICDYTTSSKKDYQKHLLTRKHLDRTNRTDKSPKNPKNAKIYKCECGKIYKARNSLWYHKQKCDYNTAIKEDVEENETQIVKIENKDSENDDVTVKDIMKMMMDDRKQIMESHLEHQNRFMEATSKMIVDVVKNTKGDTTNSHNNITNNNFNMNFFLNEQCKDALNIMDFVTSVKVKMSEVEDVGALGYAEGIGRIFVRALNELDVYQRPIHCSDLKRETLYIKDENGWEKEDETNPRIKRSIRHLAHQNVKAIPEWKEENSSWQKRHSQTEEQYYKITGNSMGACEPEGNEKNYNKIIRKVAKEVTIDKSKL